MARTDREILKDIFGKFEREEEYLELQEVINKKGLKLLDLEVPNDN